MDDKEFKLKKLSEEEIREKLETSVRSFGDLVSGQERWGDRKLSINHARLCLTWIVDIIDASTFGNEFNQYEKEECKNIFIRASRLLQVSDTASCDEIETAQKTSAKFLTDELGITTSNKRPKASDRELLRSYLYYVNGKGLSNSKAYIEMSRQFPIKPDTIKKRISHYIQSDRFDYLDDIEE